MKKLLKEWRKFIAEANKKQFPYQIYCDLDGVLVDFEGGATKYINKDLEDSSRVPENLRKTYNKMVARLEEAGRPLHISHDDFSFDRDIRINAVRNYMYARLQDNLEFWSGLDWLKPSAEHPNQDGQKLWNYIKDLDPPPLILTAPMKSDKRSGDHEGKRLWIQEHLNIPATSPRILIEKNKWEYAAPRNLLIDDTYKKVGPWLDAGGQAIHHTNTEDTIKELKEYAKEF